MRSSEFFLSKILELFQGRGDNGEKGIAVISELGHTGSHGSNASLSTVVTISIPADAVLVCLQAQTSNVRFTLDGTNPVASTTGFVVAAGADPLFMPINAGMTLKLIQDAASARVQFQFFNNQ